MPQFETTQRHGISVKSTSIYLLIGGFTRLWLWRLRSNPLQNIKKKVLHFNRSIVMMSRSFVRNIIHHHLSQGKHPIKIMVKPCQFGDRSKMYTRAIVAYIHPQNDSLNMVEYFLRNCFQPVKSFSARYSGLPNFLARSQNCEKRLLASCPSVRMEQLGSLWTGFDETWYLRLFRKSVEKIQISLKSDKNNGYFTRRRFDIFSDISLNYSQSEICFRQKL